MTRPTPTKIALLSAPEPNTGSPPAVETGPSEPVDGVPASPSRWKLWLGGAGSLLIACGVGVLVVWKTGTPLPAKAAVASTEREVADSDPTGIPVNRVRPRRKTLERILVQPGSIQPWAQAELYTKASGYLKAVPKDIGESVRAGEVLLELDTPELAQDIVASQSLVQQRQAELDAARTALSTFEAAVQSAKAQSAQVAADIRKSQSEHAFRTKELARVRGLAQAQAVTQEMADEKELQAAAALAAWESSQAKLKAAEADLAVASAKLAAARADIKVKETLVQVANDGLDRARVLAEYSKIRAPFNGVITYRGVDGGDFVQNATSGQARRLMTVAALEKIKVVLQVAEKDAPWIQVGAEATVVVDARSSRTFKGRVSRTANALEPQTRTLRTEIDLDNPDHLLLPDMYGQVTLTLQRVPDAQAVPATALYSRNGENFLLQVQDGVAHWQRVRVRYDDGKEVEAVRLIGDREQPLDGTEELIVSNKGEIAEGQRVKTTPLADDRSPVAADRRTGP